MKQTLKRLFSFLLVLVLMATLLPMVHAHGQEEQADVLTDADYAAAEAVFDKIDAAEERQYKNATQTAKTNAAEKIVLTSDNYVEGSLERNGNAFTWWTDEGIRCAYNPRMRQLRKDRVAPENPIVDGIYNEPVATKGGWPAGNQVYLVGPYYGSDSNFTDQYKYEAKDIAAALGDTDGYTLYAGSAASIENVAKAVSNGAVVIFDSHGTTDYENPYNSYDFVTGANYSYLCLSTKSGLTTADYNAGAVWDGYDAFVNGAAIANHMTKNSPGGLLWMAMCLGMATDTICEPMRDKGVEVVYGYSQSVTFAGDYLFEETFWDQMYEGATVATAVQGMKDTWGYWDWSEKIAEYYGYSDGYSTVNEARAEYDAFPIVVSDEDIYPGQRTNSSYGADSVQTVKSTYTLYSQYNVTVRSNNGAYGSVSVSGNTITAAPAEGYFAQGYTVVSGKATVTQNGNTFTVRADSDCVIQINFARKTVVSVSFSGATVISQSGYAGDSMTLPKVTAPAGYTFLGWMTEPLRSDTTEMPAYYTTSFTPGSSVTLYALYSYVDATGSTGTGDYVKVTAEQDDWTGEYLIVYEPGGYALDSSLTNFDKVSNYQRVTIENNVISAQEADDYRFFVEKYSGGYSIQGTSGAYVGSTAINTNGMATNDTLDINSRNYISLETDGSATIIGNHMTYMRFNSNSGQYRFRYYKASSFSDQQPITLYKKDGFAGTTYYTSNAKQCEHDDTVSVAAVAATCTTDGWSAGVFCNDCQSYISGHQVIPSPGHSYNSVVTPPTATEQGYTTYTCGVCGASYVSDYEEALGETHTVSFWVPTGVTAVGQMLCGKNGIILPSAGVPAGQHNYQFVGWTTEPVEDSQTTPELYEAGIRCTVDGDIDLYAVYTYVVGGTGTSGYVLTDLAQIRDTDTVVITVNYNGTLYAMTNNNGTGQAPAAVIMNYSGDKLVGEPADYLKWNMVSVSGGYTIHPAGDTSKWLYSTDTNNGIRVGTDSAKVFTMASGYLKNTSYNRYMGVYRTNPDWRSYTSIHANIADQTYGFYVKQDPGTTYYTTLDSTAACRHLAQLCTDNGDNTHTFTCIFCDELIAENQPHSYDENNMCVCGHVLFALEGTAATLKAMLQLDFIIDTTKLTGTNNYAEFTRSYADGRPDKVERVDQKDWVKYGTGTKMQASYTNIAAKEMGDEVTVVFYNAAGQQLTIPKTDSIKAYAFRGLDALKDATDAKNQKLRTVLVDMLNYGAAAQTYFAYDTADLVNKELTNTQKAWATQTDVTVENHRVMDEAGYGSTLTLKSAIQLDFLFYKTAIGTDFTGMYAVATYTDHYGKPHSVTVEGKDFTYYDTAKNYPQISVVDMAVADYQSLVTCTVYDAAGKVVAVTTDSMESYVRRALDSGRAGAKLEDLGKKLMKFSASADIYFQ